MNKSDLRKLYKNKRKSLSTRELDEMSSLIKNQIVNLDILKDNSTFHIFFPIAKFKEVNTLSIIDYLKDKDKNVIVPKVYNDSMRNCVLTKNTILCKSKWNIPEPTICKVVNPSSIDIVFIPLLICDSFGNRIGYGKGFYDKFLSSCKEGVLKIGLNYFEPISSIIPTYPTDVSLDLLVTPTKVFSF